MTIKTIKGLTVFLITALFLSTVTANAAQLRRVVDLSHVCMVNDMDMKKPQIPVKVGEQTYYGCCKMCVATLTNDLKARTAVDPVSGKGVDKAKAVIGAKPSGEVLYFENEKNLQAFTLK